MEAQGLEPVTRLPEWLPDLVLFADYRGEWPIYLEALYRCFEDDFIRSKPVFRGETLALKRHPVIQGKEATFWHIISEGDQEEERLPDLRRCERVRWPRPVIDHSTDPIVKVWTNERRGDKRICLWFADQEYLIVLARRNHYLLLWTAYPVTERHRKQKLQKEFVASKS